MGKNNKFLTGMLRPYIQARNNQPGFWGLVFGCEGEAFGQLILGFDHYFFSPECFAPTG
jgi:hypothetical protein